VKLSNPEWLVPLCSDSFTLLGTTFTVDLVSSNTCQNQAVAPVPTRDALLRSGGDKYWLDSNNCLHLKLTDLGLPWQYTSSFQRDGMYIEEVVSKYSCTMLNSIQCLFLLV
jgi:hypothetical protein